MSSGCIALSNAANCLFILFACCGLIPLVEPELKKDFKALCLKLFIIGTLYTVTLRYTIY